MICHVRVLMRFVVKKTYIKDSIYFVPLQRLMLEFLDAKIMWVVVVDYLRNSRNAVVDCPVLPGASVSKYLYDNFEPILDIGSKRILNQPRSKVGG